MKKYLGLYLLITALIVSCQSEKSVEISDQSLKEVFKDYFMTGTALNSNQIMGNDEKSMALVKKHFNTITPENCLKWENIHPKMGSYDFEEADTYVKTGLENAMYIVGHTLIWHSQIPDWVFVEERGEQIDKESLLKRMKDHIQTVVGRYKGKIDEWEVVNEAIDEEGNFRQSKWYEIIGEEYIEKAFQWAHESDPKATLYYNDYNMWYKGKRETVIQLVKNLQSKNIPIHGIGFQGHWGLDYPPMDELEESIKAYAETGLKLMFTELDISVLPRPGNITGAEISQSFELQEKLNPYKHSLPDSVQSALSKQYKTIFKLFIKYRMNISRVTFWGVHDGVSWKNNWPVRGRTNYPLLFDRNLQPKPAFFEIINLIEENI